MSRSTAITSATNENITGLETSKRVIRLMAATVRRFAERVLTGATTLKQQGRNTVDYVTAACEASVDPGVVWTRMASLAEGARLASREFW